MLQQYPGDPLLLLNRAISELQLGKLDAAKSDYRALEKTQATSPVVFFGLAQIAQKQGDKKAEIHYDELYLKYAPANTVEFTNIAAQYLKYAPTNTAQYTNLAAQLHKLQLEGH
jgi:uncharacterized membrane-anchored protein